MSISTNVNAVARRTTAEDVREMEKLLPPILRAYGAIDAKDGDSIDVLDGIHFMGLVCLRVCSVVGVFVNFYILTNFDYLLFEVDLAQKSVIRDYVKALNKLRNALSILPDNGLDCSLTLHLLTKEACCDERLWSEVELMLSQFSPNMGEQALMWRDGHGYCPLHYAAYNAPKSIIETMLELAPMVAQVRNSDGRLPLHDAIDNEDMFYNNVSTVELLTKAYPRGLVVKDDWGRNPVQYAFYFLPNKIPSVTAMVKGLVIGLSKDTLCTDHKKFATILSNVMTDEYDSGSGVKYVTQIIRELIDDYERKDDCNVCELLLALFCMASKSIDVINMKNCLEIVFGSYLGARSLSMAIEYRLLHLIEYNST